MVKLIKTNSYFNLFTILVDLIKKSGGDINKKNLVFCEEKVSLMTERALCRELGGSFNTDVYSFGNFLRVKKPMHNLLTKEGSAMAIKNILSLTTLKCFKASKHMLAPTLYDLIMQLKSARVTPENLENATMEVNGVLKNKLEDLAKVYSAYEEFMIKRGFEDQSSALSYLPDVIDKDDDVLGSEVFIVGFSGFTAQMRVAIESLVKRAKSVTFILCDGDNKMVFVGETANFVRELCKKENYPLTESEVATNYLSEGKIILNSIFAPAKKGGGSKIKTDKIYYYPAQNPHKEVEMVAEIIKNAVIKGECRYRDMTVALPSFDGYDDYVKSIFDNLDISYFLDERKKPNTHPLVLLITNYIDLFRKNFERKTVIEFIKNPLFSADKVLNDAFINYLIKYNINYNKIKEPFTFFDDEEGQKGLEELRQRFCSLTGEFNVNGLLSNLLVKDKLETLTAQLKDLGEMEEGAVNEQIYDAVIKILDQMQMLLSGVKLSLTEFKNVFLGGVSALELSIIPQYNDAVFIGDYKACALARAKNVFAIGLTSEVPASQADVALLSDKEIDQLSSVKVLVEPKIKIVNHRTRESVALALSAFSERLYLSYPVACVDGKKNVKSEILSVIDGCFELLPFPEENGYLTYKQGLKTFAKNCGEFADCNIQDFSVPSAFYKLMDSAEVKDLAERAGKEIKIQLSGGQSVLTGGQISPTSIEDYYKCPYYAFMAHGLNLRAREEGKVDSLSVGNIMHEIFCEFAKRLEEVNDIDSSNQLFENIKDKIIARDEYKKLLADSAMKASLNRVFNECRKYCFSTYLSFKDSSFKVAHAEAVFGDGKDYPAIPLLDGQVKIKGKIDRVDESDKYFRVIDYKTGTVDASEKLLFSGLKLQLYLYAAAVMGKYKDGSKMPVGLYYLPVSDKYANFGDKKKAFAEGKTLGDIDAVLAQDGKAKEEQKSEFVPVSINADGKVKNGNTSEEMEAFIKYALSASELATKRQKEGVIVPSPTQNVCEYCPFKSLCISRDELERKIGKIDKEIFINAVKGDK